MSEVARYEAPALRAAKAYLRRRYAILFYTLLLTMVAAPVLAAFDLKGDLFELFLAASLLTAVLPVGIGKTRRTLLVATVIAWLVRALTAWFDHAALSLDRKSTRLNSSHLGISYAVFCF